MTKPAIVPPRDAGATPESTDDATIDALARLASSPGPSPAEATRPLAPGLRTATLEGPVASRSVPVAFRGRAAAIAARVAPEVDVEIVERAFEEGQSALVEIDDAGAAWVVGIVQTRVPERLVLRASAIELEADREVLLRTGTAGLRLRDDGDVELVGGRIAATARGVFKLVGKILRLN
jgi:hypothetical protein